MNIQINIQVCRACLKPADSTNLVEFSSDSEVMKLYHEFLNIEVQFIDFLKMLDYNFLLQNKCSFWDNNLKILFVLHSRHRNYLDRFVQNVWTS